MLNRKDREAYAGLLADWVGYSQKYVCTVPGHEGLFHFGPGSHGHWGVHVNLRVFSAYAVAASDPSVQWKKKGPDRELVLRQALGMLRYSLHTHHSGDMPCVDGHTWGHSWIYILCFHRMMYAIEAIESELNPEDQRDIKRIYLSEAEWLLNEYPVEAGLTINNKPESNIWNGSVLIRTAMMYPDAVHAKQYLEKAKKFFANGISVPDDADDPAVREIFTGPNFTKNYGLNHHHYLNVGYMNVCLGDLAMLHFSAKHHNWKLPDFVYRHTEDLWKLVRTFTFDDGRLLRIGGDTRARYCNYQAWAAKAWALAEDLWGYDCTSLQTGWLELIKKETAVNGDGSFFSERLNTLDYQSPLYYTRLESDHAYAVSVLACLYRRFDFHPYKKTETLTAWNDDFFGAAFCSAGNRFASFVWNASEKPQALCVPKNDSSICEWRCNLAGVVRGTGVINDDEIAAHIERIFPGGFITSGSTVSYSDSFIAEGQTREDVALKQIAFAALPDGKTVLGIQYAAALNRVYGSMIKGIHWHIPNDIFNNCLREIKNETGRFTLRGGHWAAEKEILSAGNWINADEKIGLVSSLPLKIVRNGKRQIGLKNQPDINGSLYTEEICAPYEDHKRWYEKGEVLIDVSFAQNIGGAGETRLISKSFSAESVHPSLRSVSFMAAGGRYYFLAMNVSDSPVDISTELSGYSIIECTSDINNRNILCPGSAVLGYK